MDMPTLQAFEAEITKTLPKFKLLYKDQTWWMKVINFFVTPFCPSFMTSFITTFGYSVYFPSQAEFTSSPQTSFSVLAHEFVHMMDSKKYPVLYQLSYAFPQCLAPFVLGAYAIHCHLGWLPVLILFLGLVLGCWAAQKSVAFFFILAGSAFVAAAILAILFSHWWAILFFGGLALIAPLPSPGRTHWEMRGYTMNLAVQAWTLAPPPHLCRASSPSTSTVRPTTSCPGRRGTSARTSPTPSRVHRTARYRRTIRTASSTTSWSRRKCYYRA